MGVKASENQCSCQRHDVMVMEMICITLMVNNQRYASGDVRLVPVQEHDPVIVTEVAFDSVEA